MVYDTDQCRTHLNSLWFVSCGREGWGGGGVSFRTVLCVGCFGGTVLYVCIEYIQVNMYHVSTQGVDERMINVHYYYYSGA